MKRGLVVAFLFVIFSIAARAQQYVPSFQYHEHIRASGLDVPVMHTTGCPGDTIKLAVKIDRNGRLIKAKEWKSERSLRRWPLKLVQTAKRLVARIYQPFLISGQAQPVRTILEVRCKPPQQ